MEERVMEFADKAIEFYVQNRLKIDSYAKHMVLPQKTEYISIEKYKDDLEKCVKATHDLEEFCSISDAGKRYFNVIYRDRFAREGKPDWVKTVDEEYSYFLSNRESLVVEFAKRREEKELFETMKEQIQEAMLKLIMQNQGILQDDICELLPDYPEQFVIDVLMSFVEEKIVTRKKFDSTYELYATYEINKDKHLLHIPSKLYYETVKEWIYDDAKFYLEQEGYMYQPNCDYARYSHLMPLIWGQQHSDAIDESGLEKLYILLASILWEIENNVVETFDCMAALQSFRDFKTGKYNYLIEEDDFYELKYDFDKVYKYLSDNGFLV